MYLRSGIVTGLQGLWADCGRLTITYGVAGYKLNLCVKDWDLTDAISGATVTMNNGSNNVKTSNGNGWANYTSVSGTVTVSVTYYGKNVNGTSITVSADTTKNLQCKLYDVIVKVMADSHSVLLGANVTVYNSTTVQNNKIRTAFTNQTGYARLVNLPNNTLTFTVYDRLGSSSHILANTTCPKEHLFQVVASADDAFERGDTSFTSTATYLSVDAYTDPASGSYICSAFRFTNVSIPKGAKITSSSFTVRLFTIFNDINCKIYGNDVANAEDFVTNPHIISQTYRPRTTAYVSWVADDIGTTGSWVTKTGLETIIQEIVDRSDWQSGNSIVLLLIANTDNTKAIEFSAYDQGSSYAAKLDVDREGLITSDEQSETIIITQNYSSVKIPNIYIFAYTSVIVLNHKKKKEVKQKNEND
jgi:hypothetical protein